MIITTTECKALLNISTSVTTYDSLIETYIPYVTDDVCAIANHRFHDAYHWIRNDYMTFSSSAKTITLGDNSTYSFYAEFQDGDTIDVISSYNNNGFYTIDTISSSHVMSVSESLIDENSTDYTILTYIYRCDFPGNIKRIASRMIWWNVKNTQATQGDIASESFGARSISYRDTGKVGYGLYPASLTAGITKKAGSW